MSDALFSNYFEDLLLVERLRKSSRGDYAYFGDIRCYES